MPALSAGPGAQLPGKVRVLSSAAEAESRGLGQPQLASGTPLAVRTASVLSVRAQAGTGPVEPAPAQHRGLERSPSHLSIHVFVLKFSSVKAVFSSWAGFFFSRGVWLQDGGRRTGGGAGDPSGLRSHHTCQHTWPRSCLTLFSVEGNNEERKRDRGNVNRRRDGEAAGRGLCTDTQARGQKGRWAA